MTNFETNTFLFEIDPDADLVEVYAVGKYSPATAAVLWGDNMHPEEPAEIDFTLYLFETDEVIDTDEWSDNRLHELRCKIYDSIIEDPIEKDYYDYE